MLLCSRSAWYPLPTTSLGPHWRMYLPVLLWAQMLLGRKTTINEELVSQTAFSAIPKFKCQCLVQKSSFWEELFINMQIYSYIYTYMKSPFPKPNLQSWDCYFKAIFWNRRFRKECSQYAKNVFCLLRNIKQGERARPNSRYRRMVPLCLGGRWGGRFQVIQRDTHRSTLTLASSPRDSHDLHCYQDIKLQQATIYSRITLENATSG